VSEGGKTVLVDDRFPRLKAMSVGRIENCRQAVGTPDPRPWPEIEGCLTALCTARSGSTLLCRQLETAFVLGEMGEDLNPKNFKKRSAQAIVAARGQPWFAYKCSPTGLICAELSGFAEAYLHKTVYIRLLRRDIIAQAVSRAKASQTGQWHSHNKPTQEPVYDAQRIATSVRTLVVGVEQLRAYAESTGRPHAIIIYEDIAAGGVAAVKAAGDRLGLPQRDLGSDGELLRPVEKMGDEVNDEWKERFLKEMSVSVGRIVEDYTTSVERGTPARWATSESGPNRDLLKKKKGGAKHLEALLARCPAEAATLGRAAVETLRTRFPTGTCFFIDNEEKNKLMIRFGAEPGAQNAIFKIEIYGSGSVKMFLEGDQPFNDPNKILKGAAGKNGFPVKDVSILDWEPVCALLDQAVRQARTPLPQSGGGRMIRKSKTAKAALG
jgi:LPS sulfotransferase NodH